MPPQDEIDEALERLDRRETERELQAEVRKLQRKLKKEKSKTDALTEAVDEALAANARSMQVRPVRKPGKHSHSASPQVAVPWVSDLQAGKRTPTYDSDVMAKRLDRYTYKALDLIELQRNDAEVNEIRSWWLGDMIEGEDIFPGQPYLIDSSNYEQVFFTAERLIEMVRTWLTSVEFVHVEAAIGNHGRVGRRGQMSGPFNLDRFVYRIVQIALENEPRFKLEFAEPTLESGDRGWYWVSNIGELRTLLIHGDQFRGSLGVPWYGIRKKVLGWKAMGTNPRMAFPDFDDVAFGHWHQSVAWTINGIGVRGNGTTESWNDYAAENLAGMGRPSQRLQFVSPSRGMVTAEYPDVWLDDGEAPPEVPWQTLADLEVEVPDIETEVA